MDHSADRYRDLLAKPAVDIRDPEDVERWTRVLDVYTADLVHAVATVGTDSAAVLEYLRAHGIPGHRSRG
jgi:hypothetical protein